MRFRISDFAGSPALCKIYANADWEEIQAQGDRGAFEQNRLRVVPGDLSWISWRVSYCECRIIQWGIDYKGSTRHSNNLEKLLIKAGNSEEEEE
ncbi:hypothetical protein CEXT_678901 [Caerostris extrusa]|uniref:Uncharacterized protein n=1 Tax=Caerostris extrusa TaxID=172846 RepID=A0AAV4MSU6_CAEEX|nr:hypothetical protein CEXT_678901 [Caerostris extrusa]